MTLSSMRLNKLTCNKHLVLTKRQRVTIKKQTKNNDLKKPIDFKQ